MLIEQMSPPHSLDFENRRRRWRRREDLQLRQRERELDAARRICEALYQHTKEDELVERSLRTTLEVLGAEAGSVLLADPEKEQLVFRYTVGQKPIPPGTAMPWDQGLAGAVFQSGKPEVIADVKQDRRHYATIDQLTGYTTRDMIVFPLKRWAGNPIGVLEVLNKRDGRLSEEALPILTIISAFTAATIEQARLFQEAKLAEVARLTGDISHDVKNLLMPVVCGAGLVRAEINELLGRLPQIDETVRKSQELCNEIITMLLEDARRINDRVKEMADCVKGLSVPPQFAACSVAGVVGAVFKTLDLVAVERGIALRAEGLESLPLILADESRLYNAFYNLVNNAIPEVSRGGSVTVGGRVGEEKGTIVLAVADTGRGMPPEVRASLFTARVITRKAGGTGLGTKIVKDVVDAHGGTIAVESAPGAGTTFTIQLPVHPPGLSAS